MVEHHWLGGRYDDLPSLMADLVRRRVAVIAMPGNRLVMRAAKAATATIPIVFSVGEDPVKRAWSPVLPGQAAMVGHHGEAERPWRYAS
jgi:hypothetical protein